MKVKNIFGMFLFTIIMFVSISVVKATEIGADSFKTMYVPDGELLPLGTLDNVYSYKDGTLISASYYEYLTEDSTPLYCLHQGLNYCAGCTYNKVKIHTANENNPTGYGCAVINVKASGGDLNDRAAVQTAFWQRDMSNANCSSSISSIKQASKTSSRKEPSYGEWNNPTSGIQTNTLKFEKNSYALHLDENNDNYYISDAINITATKEYNINTTLPEGGYLTTSSSCSGKNLVSSPTSVKKVYACTPISADLKTPIFNITISGDYSVSATCTRIAYSGQINYSCDSPTATVYEYSRNVTDYQSLVMFTYSVSKVSCGTETIPAGTDTTKDCSIEDSHSESASLLVPLGKIKLNKTDSRTKEPVEGAKFKLYRKSGSEYIEITVDAKGNPIDIVTLADGTYTISNLVYGTYKLVEYEPATGYENSETEAKDIVIDSITTVPVNLTNTPISTLISKQDIANEKELPGAHIIVTNEYNEPILEFISGEDPKKFYLGPGKYTLVETAAPSGYDRVETVFEFEILDSGDIKLINPQDDKNIKTENNKIILYNTVVVDVPDTGKNSTIFYVIGLIMAITGSTIVLLTLRKQKVNKI